MNSVENLVERGNRSMTQGRYEQALGHFRQALELAPNHPGILNNYAAALDKLDGLDEALVVYELVRAQLPTHAGVLNNLGLVLKKLRRLGQALRQFDAAIRLNPRYAEAFNNRGNVLFNLGRTKEAFDSYDQADAIRPGHAATIFNRGIALRELKRYAEAVEAFAKVVDLDPSFPGARQHLLYARLICCDWTNYEAEAARVIRDVDAGEPPADPFYFLSLADRALTQLNGARAFGARYKASTPGSPHAGPD
jgi:protein O-GlcNAc transferase